MITLTNEEIAEALIEGIARYVGTLTIPKMEEVIASWRTHQITPHTHLTNIIRLFTLNRTYERA